MLPRRSFNDQFDISRPVKLTSWIITDIAQALLPSEISSVISIFLCVAKCSRIR